MKIQNTPNLQLNTFKKNEQNNTQQNAAQDVAFKGAGDGFAQFLRFLDTNQAWGATAVDVTCMGVPRSAVDFSRGPDAGLETMRREFSSTIDDALVGAYGVGAAWLISQSFNKQYDVKAHKMFVSDEMLNIMSHTWDENKNSKQPLQEYLDKIVSTTKGFNPHLKDADKNGWVAIDKETKTKVVDKLATELTNGNEKNYKETKAYIKSLIGSSVGAESKFKIEKQIGNNTQSSIMSLSDYIDDVYKVSKSFVNNKVADTFKAGNVTDNVFIKGLKKLNRNASIIGVAVAAGIGCSLQPINMYLTRKKTGKTGFVGVEGREPDNSKNFKLLKMAAAGVAGLSVMKTIGKFSTILSKVQFKGPVPTIPQYKFVYGMTIVSRLLSARDKNELRESCIKDTLGFASWLILGGFVSKLTASGIEKMAKFKDKGEKFIRYNEAEHGKGWFNWLTKSDVMTRDEVLFTELKKAGISTIKDGKALSFKEMMKVAPEFAKTKIKYLNMIQFAGYLYSGIALGVGIPKLNISITKSIEKKRKARMEHEHHQNQPTQEVKTTKEIAA